VKSATVPEKDPWDNVALTGWRGRSGHALGPTGRNRARSQQERRVGQTVAIAAGRSDLTDGHVVLKPYWGKPTVRNFRGARGNGARALLTGHEAGNGGYSQAEPYRPPRLASTRQSRRVQRESEGVVLPMMVVTNNTTGGKDPCFGHVRDEGKCEGMAGRTGPNHPHGHEPVEEAREPQVELRVGAKRPRCSLVSWMNRDGVTPTPAAVHLERSAPRMPCLDDHR